MANWNGAWLNDGTGLSQVTYYIDDTVNYGNIVYIAKVDAPLGSPPPPDDMASWDIYVSGAIGTSGTSGISGEAGTNGTSGTSINAVSDVNSVTSNYTIATGDNNKFLSIVGTADITITIPTNANDALAIGTQLLLYRGADFEVTIAGAAGVTLNGAQGTRLARLYSVAGLTKVAINTWVVSGDLKI